MKKLLLSLCLSLFACNVYSQANCTSGNIQLYKDGVLLTPAYAQSYKAQQAAINMANENRGVTFTLKTPDIKCVSPVLSSSQSSSFSSSFSSSQSVSSSSSSSSVNSNCQTTHIYPMMTDLSGWQNVSSLNVPIGATVVIGPHPYDKELGWSWSGCGLSSNEREVLIVVQNSCVAYVTYTNECGAIDDHLFSVNVIGQNSSSSSSSSSGSVGTFTLIWDAPTEREDGTPLPISEIGGFSIRTSNGFYYTLPATAREYKINSNDVEIATFDKNGLYSRYVKPTSF